MIWRPWSWVAGRGIPGPAGCGPLRAGLVLVTSRVGDEQAVGPVALIVELDSLGEADGAQVLLDLAPAPGTARTAQDLSEQLSGLPLALHQPPVFSVTRELWADVFRGAVSWGFAAGCLVAGCGRRAPAGCGPLAGRGACRIRVPIAPHSGALTAKSALALGDYAVTTPT